MYTRVLCDARRESVNTTITFLSICFILHARISRRVTRFTVFNAERVAWSKFKVWASVSPVVSGSFPLLVLAEVERNEEERFPSPADTNESFSSHRCSSHRFIAAYYTGQTKRTDPRNQTHARFYAGKSTQKHLGSPETSRKKEKKKKERKNNEKVEERTSYRRVCDPL